MRKLCTFYLVYLVAGSQCLSSQSLSFSTTLHIPVQVSRQTALLDSVEAIRVTKDTAVKKVDEASFVKLPNIEFQNGILEVKVLSRLLPDAPPLSRGFIGLAFRISPANDRFECIYIRPTNGRADDQVRRNRSTQYFSFPDYKFDRLRQEAPGLYESYADMGLNEWITLRIEVKGSNARLFINQQTQPCLIVKDLKLGPDQHGAIGLFVDVGTEGYFRDLKVTKWE